MRIQKLRWTVILIIISLGVCRVQPGSASDKNIVIQGNNAFALDLYAQLTTEPGNLFFCPYSIWTALTMTYAGARNNTEHQMAHVLHL
jgi:serpin B